MAKEDLSRGPIESPVGELELAKLIPQFAGAPSMQVLPARATPSRSFGKRRRALAELAVNMGNNLFSKLGTAGD